MAPKDSSDCVVTVTIELGHQAKILEQPSPEGFTHDWTVFVRGYEGSRLEYFVEKVVFKLHKTFKCPLRVISDPPFKVTESGYAGFLLPIEIHFKNKQSPRKIIFQYDLFLNAMDSPPINNVRYEKLKFQNPTPEFKAKLLKAGGIEQGPESLPYPKPDLLGSPVKVEKKKVSRPPREKVKEKVKKKKKSTPPVKPLSSAASMSSLSSLSSDNDDDDDEEEDNYAPPPPPPPPKKEKDSKKEGSLSSSGHLKQESASSSHKEKSKHRSSSTSSVHKDPPGAEKETPHKSHKHKSKDKDRDKSTSYKDKESEKKDKELSSQKSVKESQESQKEREGSHSSIKSSSSSSQGEKKHANSLSSNRDKEKSSGSSSKDKDGSGSLHKEKHRSSSKEKGKSSKHSSSKDPGLTSSEVKKEKQDASKDKKKHSDKMHKRPSESPKMDEESEKKKLKRSPSVTTSDDRPSKLKNSSTKEKDGSRDMKEKVSPKEGKEKDAKPSSKLKSEKSKHSEKHKHSHSSESKPKDAAGKKTELPQKSEKLSKSDSLTKSERLAMTAVFQPQLRLSPLKSPPHDEEEPTLSPAPADKASAKLPTRSHSLSSLSSGNSSDAGEKSDNDIPESQAADAKNIVSGLTDSDSDSEDETPPIKSPQKELKSAFSKQAQQSVHKSKSFTAETSTRRESREERIKKMDSDSVFEETKKKYGKEEKKVVKHSESKKSKQKCSDTKSHSSDEEDVVDHVNEESETNIQPYDGLDIAAPNGIPIRELIAINEKIEKAQEDANQEVLEKVAQIIGETDDFDLDDSSVFFDICSVEKSVVLQIQAALRDL